MYSYDYLWLIPFFPLVGAIINGFLGKKIKNETVIGGIGTLAIASSFLVSCSYFFQLLKDSDKVHQQVIASWMSVGQLQVDWGFLLDPLSALMIMVVTGVGSLIHLYSIGYMHGEEGFYRFFSYLNLFCFSMLMLVLGNNALVMFVGWEGVGLCSYLLIGYYFHKKSAGDAAKKAFVVNRIGDFGFLVGLFTLFWALGSKGVWTVNFVEISENAHLLYAWRHHRYPCNALFLRRRHRQVGTASAVYLVARRHGRPDPGFRPDPCGYNGHCRCLHDRPHEHSVRHGARPP